MDLLLEDIGKMDFFTKIWEQGKAIVLWIRQHQSFAAKFSKIASKSLLLPGDTHCTLNVLTLLLAGDTSFGTTFIMLSREIELQDEIVQLVGRLIYYVRQNSRSRQC